MAQSLAAGMRDGMAVRVRSTYLWYAVRRRPSMLVGFAVVAVVLACAIVGPAIWTIDPSRVSSDVLLPPSRLYPFGTDQYGRDLLARVLNGSRLDVAVAAVVCILATLIGSTIGAAVGYLGGWVEQVAMRITDVLLAFPGFILALAIAVFLGNDIRNVIFAIAVAYTPVMVRLIRGHALALRKAQFVLAAKGMGASARSIVLGHVLPNTLSSVLVQATLFMAWAVLDTAGLSFIGVGIRPPTAELGSMTGEGADFLISGSWWFALLPGLVIMVIVLGFNLVGDAVRDLFDRRSG
jgi:peptide/nickel transport system permease protein